MAFPFQFGKRPAQRDARTFLFSDLLRAALPKVATSYDVEQTYPGIPCPMFANDWYGDCVIAGRAHQTLFFERAEQGKTLQISDNQVIKEYFTETGGSDSGLYVLESLKLWRSRGWKCGSPANTYKIKAFAQIAGANKIQQIKQAMFADLGCGIGFKVPRSALDQFQAGKTWDVATKPGPIVDLHYVYVLAYTPALVYCRTWARRQAMTWRFFTKYTDEIYAIIDAQDTTQQKRFLRLGLLNVLLKRCSSLFPLAEKPCPNA